MSQFPPFMKMWKQKFMFEEGGNEKMADTKKVVDSPTSTCLSPKVNHFQDYGAPFPLDNLLVGSGKLKASNSSSPSHSHIVFQPPSIGHSPTQEAFVARVLYSSN